MRKMSKRGKDSYVNCSPVFFTACLWKRAVEKPVETVEKLGFSTAIPGISPGEPPENPCHFPESDLSKTENRCVTETKTRCPFPVLFAEKVGIREMGTPFSGNGAKDGQIFL